MKGWLLDTNVVSLFAPDKSGKRRIDEAFSAWTIEHTGALFLSVISVAEIESGIAKLHRSGAVRRAETVDEWLARILSLYGNRVLVIDTQSAKIAGRILDRALSIGRNPGISDVFIAATAERHGLTLMTNNLKHFEPLRLTIDVVPVVSD